MQSLSSGVVVPAVSLLGPDAHLGRVVVQARPGPSCFEMYGITESQAREVRVRITSALGRLGVHIEGSVVVRVEGEGTPFNIDMAVAAGLLALRGLVPVDTGDRMLLLGELGLSGELRPVRGVLPALQGTALDGFSEAVVPAANAREAGLVPNIIVRAVRHLGDLVAFLNGAELLPVEPTAVVPVQRGDPHLARAFERLVPELQTALEVAAAGVHPLLWVVAPGGGSTLLARLLHQLLPALDPREALEVTGVHSLAGLVDERIGYVSTRPFRAPHHTVSTAGMIGGGVVSRPGEVSLAHRGVLYLDELGEFRESVVRELQRGVRAGESRLGAGGLARFPAQPLLVAAIGPCPCGYFGHPTEVCRCSPGERERYRQRAEWFRREFDAISVSVPAAHARAATGGGSSFGNARSRIAAARLLQRERQRIGLVGCLTNSELSLTELERVAVPDPEVQRLLGEQPGLGLREQRRVLRVARTMADLSAVRKAEEVRRVS